jgi:hypothetical protein
VDEKILTRLKRLLALAQSDNVHEAANAAGLAQKLMTEHQLSEAMLASLGATTLDTSGPAEVSDDYLAERKPHSARKELWKGSIAAALADANACKTYWQGPNLRVIGTPINAGTVRYLYAYLTREVERLAAAYKGRCDRKWLNSFRVGAAYEIADKIREGKKLAERDVLADAKKLAAANPVDHGANLVRTEYALSLVKNELERVTTFAKKNLKLKTGRAATISNASGYYLGREVGATVNLAAGRGLGAGK